VSVQYSCLAHYDASLGQGSCGAPWKQAIAVQGKWMRVSPQTNFKAVFVLAAIVGLSFLLLPVVGLAQTAATGCTLAVEGTGGTGMVMVNASGCAGDIAIIAKAGSNQKQFAIGSGGEVYQPFSLTPCDLGISEKTVSVTYTAVVVNGKDAGKTSAAYSGTIEPPPTSDDAPPSVKFSGKPSPATYVRPGDTIAPTVHLTDDIGLTAVKVIDPSGAIVLNKRITPTAPRGGCHERPPGQSATFSIPDPYIVPTNPATPSIRYTAIARDSSGHEITAFADYWTEAVWAGPMTLAGSAHAGTDTCNTSWRVEVSVKTTPIDAVSGHAEARHTPIVGCRYTGTVESLDTFSITGTTDGKMFTLFFKPTGGVGIAFGIGALHLLALPSPLPVVLTRTREDRAEGKIGRDNSGPIEGKGASASIAGEIALTCCFADQGAPEPAKRTPTFLGQDDK